MIGQLNGTVTPVSSGFIIINVQGVGYRVRVTTETYQKIAGEKKTITLLTHLAVRENALDLYGFLTREELKFFELLISISGIGPKSAIAILSIADVATLSSAISRGESAYLTKVSGIGRKIAEKIVLELRDKIGSLTTGEESGTMREEEDVLEALKSLGYSLSESRDALKKVPKETAGASERLKMALKILGS